MREISDRLLPFQVLLLQSHFDGVALLTYVESVRGAEAIAAPGAFVDVPTEKIDRLDAIDPLFESWAAGVFSSSELVETRALRREMNDEIERLEMIESRKRFRDFLF